MVMNARLLECIGEDGKRKKLKITLTATQG